MGYVTIAGGEGILWRPHYRRAAQFVHIGEDLSGLVELNLIINWHFV